MKVTWEELDIEAGKIILKSDSGLAGTHMIGFRYDTPDAGIQYGIVSLADGQYVQIGSKAQVAQYLNRAASYLPAEVLDKRFTVVLPEKVK